MTIVAETSDEFLVSRTPEEWDAVESSVRQIPNPVVRKEALDALYRERERAEKLRLAASMSQGRPRDREARVQFVYDLVDAHRDLARKPAKLRKLDVEGKLGNMSDARFRALVADARKSLGLP